MSDNWEERALLGERLARRLDTLADREQVLRLLLDDRDAAVTYRTALALLQRRDRLGLELIVTASTQADDDTNLWLGSAVAQFRAGSLGQTTTSSEPRLARCSATQDRQRQGSCRILTGAGELALLSQFGCLRGPSRNKVASQRVV